jgi:hypothetical protein
MSDRKLEGFVILVKNEKGLWVQYSNTKVFATREVAEKIIREDVDEDCKVVPFTFFVND